MLEKHDTKNGQSDSRALELKMKFFSKLAALSNSRDPPNSVFEQVTDLWNEVLGCKWTTLWLRTSFTYQTPNWKPNCISPKDFAESPIPPCLSVEKEAPVTEFAYQTQKPVYVFDQDAWKAELASRQYRVLGRSMYHEMGSDSFLTVAFPTGVSKGENSGDGTQMEVIGALSCHFATSSELREIESLFGIDDLSAMATLSASVMRDSLEHQNFDLLVDLNQHASNALTKISKNPRADRREFVDKICTMISDVMKCKAVSVFYRMPLTQEVACIYSRNGLLNKSMKRIPSKGLLNCRYKLGESRTGTVFETGKPLLLMSTKPSNSEAKYLETFSNGDAATGSTVMQPIPQSSPSKQTSKDPKSVGVVRCVGRESREMFLGIQDFDILEVQTLRFICQQISPVLDTLGTRIQREDQVNSLKHDLLIPAGMIRDSADELELEGEKLKKIIADPYVFSDISMASRLLGNLIHQLDAEPGTLSYSPRPTFLEGDIIARNKNMLKHYADVTKGMEISFGSFNSIPKLEIDPNLVERAFFNLIVNAIKYGAEGSTLHIAPRVEYLRDMQNGRMKKEFFIDFSNYGEGIADGDQEKVFDRYFRSAWAKTEATGLGLGLYIARAAIRKNMGDLFVSCLRSPTTFTVRFPSNLQVSS